MPNYDFTIEDLLKRNVSYLRAIDKRGFIDSHPDILREIANDGTYHLVGETVTYGDKAVLICGPESLHDKTPKITRKAEIAEQFVKNGATRLSEIAAWVLLQENKKPFVCNTHSEEGIIGAPLEWIVYLSHPDLMQNIIPTIRKINQGDLLREILQDYAPDIRGQFYPALMQLKFFEYNPARDKGPEESYANIKAHIDKGQRR